MNRKVVSLVAVLAVLAVGTFIAFRGQPPSQAVVAKESQAACAYNLRQIGHGLLMYATDHDDRLPTGEWMTQIATYTPEKALHCPAVQATDPTAYGYAFNADLWSADPTKIPKPEARAVVYDSISIAQSVSDPGTSIPQPDFRHRLPDGTPVNNILMLDGHVEAYSGTSPPKWFPPKAPLPRLGGALH